MSKFDGAENFGHEVGTIFVRLGVDEFKTSGRIVGCMHMLFEKM